MSEGDGDNVAQESVDGPAAPVRATFQGVAASPGVGIGPAYVVDERRIHVRQEQLDRDAIDDEVKRFRGALRTTQEQLERIKARLPHGEHRQIMKAQQMMLRDPDFTHRTENIMRDDAVNAEWALSRVVDEVRETLGQADDEYFRERRSDVSFLGERVLQNLQGDHPGEIAPPTGAVVVAHDLSPADMAELARASVVGIVTDVGGKTSHSAIMARSLELPAVVGVEGVTKSVRSGDMVVVDAIHGHVLTNPAPEELERWTHERDRYEAFEDRVQKEHALPAIAKDGRHVVLRANAALDEEVSSAVFHGAEGIGLYRTEYIFMGREDAPTEEEHYRHAKAVLRKVTPYPVTYRTFDLGSDKKSSLIQDVGAEANPAMGLRSLRLALREREMFLAQLRGLMRAALHGPLRIMLPLVSGLSELRLALDCVREAGQQLADAGMAHSDDVPVGIMIEMPSAALVADVLVEHVDFVSIGTNDLIQYTLAIDRENEEVSYLYQPMHPAILRLIKMVTDAARGANIPVSLCGEMAADPRYTWVLAGLGVTELSMHPSAIPVIKSIIRGSDSAEMEELAHRVLAAAEGPVAEKMVFEVMQERFPEHLEHGGAAGSLAEDDTDPAPAPVAETPWIKTRLVSLPAGRVFVEESGPQDGPAVVCLHGLLTTHHTFRFLRAADALGANRFILLDFLGAGDSDRPRPGDADEYSLDFLGECVAKTLEALGVEEAVLVGHDLGGTVAMHLAAEPAVRERLRKLVLIAPACFPFELPLSGRISLLPVLGDLTFAAFRRRDLERILARGFVERESLEDSAVDVYWDRLGRAGGLTAAHAMLKNFERLHRLVHVFPRVQTQTLVIWGDGDRLIDPQHGVSLVTELPSARLATVEGAGHSPHEERPNVVIELIAQFLVT